MPKKVEYHHGQKVGEFIFLNVEPKRPGIAQRRAKFICRCGKEYVTYIVGVANGDTKSCGCEQYAHATKHGKWQTVEYATWHNIISRCRNKKNKRYGGRGIKVCDRWNASFENFLVDMGLRPSDAHSIERINNDGDYEPLNCRWATHKEQSRNTRSNVNITFNGETMCLKDWAIRLSINRATLQKRVKKWDIKKALTTSINKNLSRNQKH